MMIMRPIQKNVVSLCCCGFTSQIFLYLLPFFTSFVYFPLAPTRRAWPPRSVQFSLSWL